jgi:F-type H+-transporting ATPase subunit epsilon
MATFHFELVSPERMLFSGDVDSVVVPASEGEMTVLAGHAPAMSSLKPGVVTVSEGKGQTRRLFVRGGFVDINEAGLTILAEHAVALEDLKPEALAIDIKNATDDVADARTADARAAAQAKLDGLKQLQAALVN